MGTKKLKVFEAFAGIGAQSVALKRANINFENVGISEWFVNAILAYDAINNSDIPEPPLPSYEKQIEYLSQFTFSWDLMCTQLFGLILCISYQRVDGMERV